MQGSVRKRGTTWSYRIDFGKIDGERRQIEKGGYKNKKEADKALADALYQVNNYGEFVENQKITFSEVFDEFITTEAPATRAYATIKRYNSLYRNHYQVKFGGLFVYQISANMVNDFLNEKRLKYSEEYVKGLYKTLKVLQLRQESLNSAILPTKNRYFVIEKSNLQKKLHMPRISIWHEISGISSFHLPLFHRKTTKYNVSD